LVPQGHPVPTTGFANNAEARRLLSLSLWEPVRQDIASAVAGGILFSNRPHYRYLPALRNWGLGSGGGKGTKRAFCVHTAAPIKKIPFATNGHFTRKGIDVAQ